MKKPSKGFGSKITTQAVPSPSLLNQWLDQALDQHQQGQLQLAEALYQRILGQDPNHAEALHWLGVLAYQVGRLEMAEQWLTQSIRIRADQAESHNHLGIVLKAQDKLEAAIEHYQQAISLNPEMADVPFNLGIALHASKRLPEAASAYRRALQLQPDYVEAHTNLGTVLLDQGRLPEAESCFRQALSLNPQSAPALNSLGNVLQAQEKLEGAIVCYQKAIEFKPDYAEAHNNWGAALQALGQIEEAIACHRKALAIKADSAEAFYYLGNALRGQGNLPAAIESYHRSLALKSGHFPTHNNLGVVLQDLGQPEAAIENYQQVISQLPNSAEAHFNLGIALLMAGEWQQGFEKYEWRWQTNFMQPRVFEQPAWNGSDLDGRTLLLWCEQGLGDGIQFIRYAPLLAERGATVIVECLAPLQRLFNTVAGIQQVVLQGSELPDFDLQAPLLSLPHWLGTTIETVPTRIPYVSAPSDPSLSMPDPPEGAAKVGFVWSSGYREKPELFRNYQQRSCPLVEMMRLSEVAGVSLYSLQMGQDRVELDPYLIQNPSIVDLSPRIRDFADTAALIEHLDLVITVDTSVAHLAGALGKPVWILLPFAADWRWLMRREDSVWYPSARLFRQVRSGDWTELVARVTDALKLWRAGLS